MRCSNVVSAHNERPNRVARLLQVTEHSFGFIAKSEEPRDVLSNDPTGSDSSHDPQELRPQPTVVFGPEPLAGD